MEKILDDYDFDVDDSIKCKKWIHTDGIKFIDMQLSVSEFIDMFLEKFDLLRRHHCIANAQSAFFQSTKETLPSDTVIILLNFTENYSFWSKMQSKVITGKTARQHCTHFVATTKKKDS